VLSIIGWCIVALVGVHTAVNAAFMLATLRLVSAAGLVEGASSTDRAKICNWVGWHPSAIGG